MNAESQNVKYWGSRGIIPTYTLSKDLKTLKKDWYIRVPYFLRASFNIYLYFKINIGFSHCTLPMKKSQRKYNSSEFYLLSTVCGLQDSTEDKHNSRSTATPGRRATHKPRIHRTPPCWLVRPLLTVRSQLPGSDGPLQVCTLLAQGKYKPRAHRTSLHHCSSFLWMDDYFKIKRFEKWFR